MYVVGQSSHGQVAAAVGGDHAWGPTGRLPCDERPTRIGTGARTSVLQKSPAAGYQIPRCRWRTLRGEQEAVEPIDDARHAYVLVALFLVTGCRLREITGLELDDVFRPADHHHPTEPMAAAQDTHVAPGDPAVAAAGSDPSGLGVRPRLERGGTLLVPSWTASGDERRLQDISKLLDRGARPPPGLLAPGRGPASLGRGGVPAGAAPRAARRSPPTARSAGTFCYWERYCRRARC